MILLFLLLIVVAVGILAIRRQSYFQHREMMRTLNPELVAKQDAEDRRKADKTAQGLLMVLVIFGLLFLFAFCAQLSQQFKGFIPDSPKIESNKPAPNFDPLKPNPGTFPSPK